MYAPWGEGRGCVSAVGGSSSEALSVVVDKASLVLTLLSSVSGWVLLNQASVQAVIPWLEQLGPWIVSHLIWGGILLYILVWRLVWVISVQVKQQQIITDLWWDSSCLWGAFFCGLKHSDSMGWGLSQTSASAGAAAVFEAWCLTCAISQAWSAVMLFSGVSETRHHQWSLFLCSPYASWVSMHRRSNTITVSLKVNTKQQRKNLIAKNCISYLTRSMHPQRQMQTDNPHALHLDWFQGKTYIYMKSFLIKTGVTN